MYCLYQHFIDAVSRQSRPYLQGVVIIIKHRWDFDVHVCSTWLKSANMTTKTSWRRNNMMCHRNRSAIRYQQGSLLNLSSHDLRGSSCLGLIDCFHHLINCQLNFLFTIARIICVGCAHTSAVILEQESNGQTLLINWQPMLSSWRIIARPKNQSYKRNEEGQ